MLRENNSPWDPGSRDSKVRKQPESGGRMRSREPSRDLTATATSDGHYQELLEMCTRGNSASDLFSITHLSVLPCLLWAAVYKLPY